MKHSEILLFPLYCGSSKWISGDRKQYQEIVVSFCSFIHDMIVILSLASVSLRSLVALKSRDIAQALKVSNILISMIYD